MALASGVDLQTVSRALGHESSAITSRIYAHAVESLQQEAASKINDHFSDAVNGSVDRAFNAVRGSSVPQRCHSPGEDEKKAHDHGLFHGSANGNRIPLLRFRPIPSSDKNAYLIRIPALRRSNRFRPLPGRFGRSATDL
jgi:hypothetical protein